MLKRRIVVLLALTLFIIQTVLVAADEKKKILFATSIYVEAPHKAVLDKLIKEYNKINPKVEIEIYGAGWSNFWDNVTTEILSGKEADIIQMYPEDIARYHALRPEGTFLNLDSKIKGTKLETDLVGQDECTYDGKYVAVSNYAWGTTGLFYRKSMLKKAGVDPNGIKSLDDFRAACLKLTKGDESGFGVVVSAHSFVVSEWARFLSRVVSKGLYFPNESGPFTAERLNVNDPANVWAAQWWQDLLLKDKVARIVKDKKDAREMFWNGKVALNLDGPWFIGMTRDRDPSLFNDVGLIPQPYVVYNGAKYRPNPTLYPLITAISNKSKYKDEAWDFLKWMTTPDAQKIIAECGMIPNSKAYVGKAEYKKSNPLAYRFFDFIQNSYDPLLSDPSIPQMGELQQVMIEATQKIFADRNADAKAVLDDAESQMQTIMRK
jgi:multiple sugar transport system substrate-binding protein